MIENIKYIDNVNIYLAWKILTNWVRQATIMPYCFKNVEYFYKDQKQKYFIDNFKELNTKTRPDLFVFNIQELLLNWVLKECNIYIEENENKENIKNIKINKDFLKTYRKNIRNIERDNNVFFNFTKGFYSIIETQLINGLGINHEIPVYNIYFAYIYDNKILNRYIENYLRLWWNEKLIAEWNYILPNRQISYFSDLLIKNINNYWDVFEYSIGTNSQIDEITLILYFNIQDYIEITWFNEGPVNIPYIWYQPIKFKIKVLQKFYDTFTRREWLFFDEKKWDVILDWDSIWNIPLDTQPYYFFQFLYNDRGNIKSHKKIKEHIKGKEKIEKWDSYFCSNVKGDLPNKKIKDLIKSPKGWYRIP
jgi:hypothetical protein